MLAVAQKQYIKHQYEVEEKSLRQIAQMTGHSFQTVQKYAYQENWSTEELPNVEATSYPVLGNYIPLIDEWLEGDKKIPRKQRHTVWRIYTRLRDEQSFLGSYSSVKKYVRKKKFVMKQAAEGFLPLMQCKAEAQIDFGEFVYYDKLSKMQKAYALTITFPYSNNGFTQAFPSQNQECLLTGMQRIFERIGGVPARLRADNMTTAVAQVLEGSERVLSEGFVRFMLHYRFEAEFCNPAAGNEKGNVENKVGCHRRNLLVPVPIIEDFEVFNEELWQRCEKDAEREHYKHKVPISELWEEERSSLLALPEHPYTVFRYEALRVNKYGFAVIDTNKYGLPPSLAGETVQAKIYFNSVEFFHDHTPVGRYRRSYGTSVEVMDWTQYVDTLCRKPGAAVHTRFFNQMPQLWQQHLTQTQGKERKNALQLLREIVSDGNAPLCEDALILAGENGRTDTDSIRQFYYMIAKKEHRPQPLCLLSCAPSLNYNPNLAAYDGLMGGEAVV